MRDSPFSLFTLDRFFEYAAVIMCFILFIFNIIFIKDQIIFLTLLFLIIFLIIYVRWPGRALINETPFQEDSPWEATTYSRIFASSFFFIITFEIVYTYFFSVDNRGYLTFFLYAAQALFIGLQIIWRHDDTKSIAFILFQIIILGLIIRLSLGLSVPSVIGNDPWYHQGFVNEIIEQGTIPLNEPYTDLPMFHLLLISGMELMNLSYGPISFLFISTSQVVMMVFFLYLLGKKFISRHIGLFSALIIVLSNTSLLYGLELIPNTLGPLLWLPFIYIIIFRQDFASRGLAIIIGGVIVLTHTISALGLFVVLLTFVLSYFFIIKLPGNKKNIYVKDKLTTLPILFGSMMFAWWSYASGSISELGRLIKVGFSADIIYWYMDAFQPYSIQLTLPGLLIGNVGRILFFCIALVGVVYCIRLRNQYPLFSAYSIASIIPLFLGYFTFFIDKTIIAGRWWYFSQILSAVTVTFFLNTIIKRSTILNWRMITVVLVALLCFLMLISSDANVDNNQTGENTSSRHFLYSSEIMCTSYIRAHVDSNFDVDTYYVSAFNPFYNFDPEKIGNIGYDLLINEMKTTSGAWVIRDEVINHPGLFNGIDCQVTFDVYGYTNMEPDIKKVYDCQTVRIYY